MTLQSLRYAGSRGSWAAPAAAAAGVLMWRVAAFKWPSSFVGIPDGLHVPLALLGALFLVCGLLAWWLRPSRWAAIFLLYAFAGGIHWGGAVGATHATIAISLFLLYLAITVLGDAALLHLALIYPRQRTLAKEVRIALYSPAAVATSLAVGAVIAPKELLEPAAGILLLVANLFSLVAGMLFVVRLFTSERAVRLAARLPLIATGMLVGSVIALLGAGGLLPGEPESWNLTLGVIPVTLAIALVSQSVGSETDDQTR